MKLKTSYFNQDVLKKDITRFAPAWGLYTVFMLMTLFLLWTDENDPARFAANAQYIMQSMGVVNFFYAGICALLLFGDLCKSRMCNALHAMPLRREGWFLTHLTAGLLFSLVPNALGAALSCVILQEYCYLAFLWLGIMMLQFLFFFGAGAFSIQCAGNLLGAAAVYGLFNLLAVLAAFLADTFYVPVLYGMETDWQSICRCAPVVGFTMSEFVAVDYDNMHAIARFEGFISRDWRYLLIAAGVGLVLLGASLLLYRRRQLESAGDFMAVKSVSPVFLVIYTLCVGAVFYFIADTLATDAEYVFLLIGFAIGFFTGWMLLEKKVNVFQSKKFLGFGILTLVFFLTITVTWLDPVGVTRYVPEVSQVSSVTISPYASDYYLENRGLTLTGEQEVQEILEIHSRMIESRYPDEGNLCVRLRYKLRGGATVSRTYYIDAESEIGKTLEKYFSRFSYVTGGERVDALVEKAQFMEFYSHTTDLPNMLLEWNRDQVDGEIIREKYGDSEEWRSFSGQEGKEIARGLLEAIYLDCQAGTMAQQWDFHYGQEAVGNLTICFAQDRYTTEYMDVVVFADSENTINYLKSLANS